MAATVGLAALAGILSILSPCVLPLLPLIFAGAAAEHRFAPLALAAGLALSFTAIGLFVATVGFSIGLDSDVFRFAAAILFLAVGAVLVVPSFQTRLATAAGPLANWSTERLGGFSTAGIGGQFALGLLLGAVWIPCVGPTLGAASLLASQGRDLGGVTLTMLAFGIGAALPLALLGALSRAALLAWRSRLAGAAGTIRMALGAVLIVFGAAILAGFDHRLETALVQASPPWLTELTTRY